MTVTETPAPPAAPSAPTPPPRPPTRSSRAPAIVSIVLVSVGVLVLIAGIALGGVLTRRDRAGFFHTSGPLRSDAYAVTSQPAEFGPADPDVPAIVDDIVTLRVRATPTVADKEVFVGIAPKADVDRYLAGVAHDVVSEVDTNPFRATLRSVAGTAEPSAPGTQTFWTASTTGTGEQELRWHPGDTDWTVVVMNADGSRQVVTQTDIGVRVDWLEQLAVGLVVLGALCAVSGGVIWFTLGRRPAH